MAATLKKKPAKESADLSPQYLASLKWLSARQTCSYLQLGRSTLDALIKAGSIPVSRPTERILRFNREQLDSWLASQSATA